MNNSWRQWTVVLTMSVACCLLSWVDVTGVHMSVVDVCFSHSAIPTCSVSTGPWWGGWRWRPPGTCHVLWDGRTETVWRRWWAGVERDCKVLHSARALSDVVMYLSARGATGRALDLRSTGRGLKSYSGQSCVTTLGKLFTPMCLCHHAV